MMVQVFLKARTLSGLALPVHSRIYSLRVSYFLFLFLIFQFLGLSQQPSLFDTKPNNIDQSPKFIPHELFRKSIQFSSIHGNKNEHYMQWMELRSKNLKFKENLNAWSYSSVLHSSPEFFINYPSNQKIIFNYRMIEANRMGGWEEAFFDILKFGVNGFSYWYADREKRR